MNWILDGIVVFVILGSAFFAWRKGFLRAALGFLPMLSALVGIKYVSPYVSKFLRGTKLFSSLADSISSAMNLERLIGESGMKTQAEIIKEINLPNFLQDALMENNNPVIYQLLDVEKLQDYISGFLANICLNVVSGVLAFVLIYVGVSLFLHALNLFSKLPILNGINHFAGFLVGALKGLLFVWIGFVILTFFQCNAKLGNVFMALETTFVAKVLYEHNFLLDLILKIFT